MYTYSTVFGVFPTNRPSFWSAREGNRMRLLVLFEFVCVLSVSVCADLCGQHVYVYICVVDGRLYVCLLGIHAQPDCWLDLGAWSCGSLTSQAAGFGNP